MAFLLLKTPDGKEKRIPLIPPSLTIGKDDPASGIFNQLSLNDPTVSRRHARLYYEKKTWYVEDLGSKNATYLNEKKVLRSPLKPGDVLRIGQNILIFQEDSKKISDLYQVSGDILLPSGDTTVDLNYLLMERISSQVLMAEDPISFVRNVAEILTDAFRVEKCLFLVCEKKDEEEEWKIGAKRGDSETFYPPLVSFSVKKKEVLLYPHDSLPFSFPPISTSLLIGPVFQETTLVGVYYLETSRKDAFGEGDRILMRTVIQQVSAGLERLKLYEKIRESVRIRTNLERFFSPPVVEMILKESRTSPDLALPPRKYLASFLFADIQGFSSLAERLPPLEVAHLLRDHFTRMTEIIFQHEGIVDKYMGDCIMAVFGVPYPYEDHAHRAVQCAIKMREEHHRFLSELPSEKRFHIRIGINTGEAVAGYMGSPRRLEYTVLGEAVILANRLQSVAEPDQIYVGKETYLRIRSFYKANRVEGVVIKGGKTVEVYTILPPDSTS